MVKRAAFVAIALLAATVRTHAHPVDEGYVTTTSESEADEPAFNLFGFHGAFGALPYEGRTRTFAIGVSIEHPVFPKTRVFGEYEWLWLRTEDERAVDSVVMRPERYANGHRAWFGLRRELIAKTIGRRARRFIDGELAAGTALVNDSITGVALIPSVLAGVRAGYDLYSRTDDSPSRMFELEVTLRAIAVTDGVGASFGLGMAWGN
jgi:hypothetical protein